MEAGAESAGIRKQWEELQKVPSFWRRQSLRDMWLSWASGRVGQALGHGHGRVGGWAKAAFDFCSDCICVKQIKGCHELPLLECMLECISLSLILVNTLS